MFQGFICEPFVIRIQSYCNQGILYQKQAKKKMIMLNSRPSLQSPPWCVDLPSTGPKLRWHKPSTHPASRLIAKWTWSPLVHFLLRVISHNSPICGWIWLTPLWIMFFYIFYDWIPPTHLFAHQLGVSCQGLVLMEERQQVVTPRHLCSRHGPELRQLRCGRHAKARAVLAGDVPQRQLEGPVGSHGTRRTVKPQILFKWGFPQIGVTPKSPKSLDHP